MKRKLSSSSSEEEVLHGNAEQVDVEKQAQQSGSLELEQSTEYYGTGGFVLAPHLALKLGMSPGEILFRSMFYGTPQTSIVSSLAAQLLDEHEALVSNEAGEGSSSTQYRGGGCNSALMDYNERTIQALLDSIEEPRFAVVPPVVAESIYTVHKQVPCAALKKSTVNSDGEFMLTPDLAMDLGMQPGQALRRGMFHGTPQSHIVLSMVNQFLEIQSGLLRNQELERANSETQDVISFGSEYTAHLIATNEELIKALMSSIEAPTVIVPSTIVADSETESEKILLAKLEEERNQRLARSKARLEREAQEIGIVKVIHMAKLREANLIRAKNKLGDSTGKTNVAVLSSAEEIDEKLETVIKKRKAISAVLGTRLSTVQEMERELEEVRNRKRELDRVGAKKSTIELEEIKIRVKEIEIELSIKLDLLIAAELELKERVMPYRKTKKVLAMRLDKELKRAAKEKTAEANQKARAAEEDRKARAAEKDRKTRAAEEDRKARAAEKDRKTRVAEEDRKARAESTEKRRRATLEKKATREKSRIEEEKRMKALVEERKERMRRELMEKREMEVSIRALELELERVIGLDKSGEVWEERAITVATREELELELDVTRAQEQKLGPELDRLRVYAMNLDIEIRVGRIISGATASEIEAKKDRLKEMNRNRSLARVRELELMVGLSKAKLRARGLVLALEKLEVAEQDQD
ncbi:hypothetical protein [Candidatus Ichthyocystis sparus]|uniref:hypothetical protein n=1 Tax=Candidatus Ichthyocystis sparus TaxID=1561004 RepID=UPI000A7962EF|nr:hypothetical protein [Candidatus Ichthyocystis sparus]